MWKISAAIGAALIAALAMSASTGARADNGEVDPFASKALQAGDAEIADAKYAQAQSSNTAIKRIATKLQSDHEKANARLRGIVGGGVVSDSGGPKGPSSGLQGLVGNDFDREYINEQIQAHKEAIDLFATEADEGGDARLKAFAVGELPALKRHLKMLEGLKLN